jgi:hypothetical protein
MIPGEELEKRKGKMPRLQRVGIFQCYPGRYPTKLGFALTLHLSFERGR